MKLLEVKVHHHEIEARHMSRQFRIIMNWFKRFMKLVEHFRNIGWKFHEQTWSRHEFDLHFYEVSNRLGKKVTSGLHITLWLLCWINERYACKRLSSLSRYVTLLWAFSTHRWYNQFECWNGSPWIASFGGNCYEISSWRMLF